MRRGDVVLEDIAQPSQQRFDGFAIEVAEVARGLQVGDLDHVGRVESTLNAAVEQSMCDDIEIGTESIQQFALGRFVAGLRRNQLVFGII